MIKKRLKRILGRDEHRELLNKLAAEHDTITNLWAYLKTAIDEGRSSSLAQKEYVSNEIVALKTQTNKKRLLITGYYGARNCGDELMLRAILDNIDFKKFDVTILCADNYYIDLSIYSPCNVVHYPRRPDDILYISKYFDVVLWGGGAVIDDTRYRYYHDEENDLTYIATKITISMLKMGKTAYILGVSTNKDLKDPNLIRDLSYIVKNAQLFALRDTNSLKTLQNSGINTKTVKIIDDLALALTYDKKSRKTGETFTIGVVFIMNDENIEYLSKFVIALSKSFNGRVLIKCIPFFDKNGYDSFYFERMNELTKKANVAMSVADNDFTPEGVADAFSSCDLIFSMRYHATLIASFVMGINTVSINCSSIHKHYYNKTEYIKQHYSKSLSDIDYLEILNRNKLSKAITQASLPSKANTNSKSLTSIRKEIEDLIKDIK